MMESKYCRHRTYTHRKYIRYLSIREKEWRGVDIKCHSFSLPVFHCVWSCKWKMILYSSVGKRRWTCRTSLQKDILALPVQFLTGWIKLIIRHFIQALCTRALLHILQVMDGLVVGGVGVILGSVDFGLGIKGIIVGKC